MPETEPDGADTAEYSWKLPSTRVPEPIMPGVRGWKTSDGYLVLRLHYTADPERATEEWKNYYVVGYRGGFEGRDWLREMEIDFCVGLDTRVLTSDLRWVSASCIQEGDEVVGFDEDNSPCPRRWHNAQVMRAKRVRLPAYRLTFSDGTEIISSEHHRWLNGYGQKWRFTTTERLRKASDYPAGSKVVKFVEPWESDESYEAGYLSAAFDGEGCISQSWPEGSGVTLQFGQKENAMLDKVVEYLDNHKFTYGFRLHRGDYEDPYYHIALQDRSEVIRFLGQIRPQRLLDKLDLERWGQIKAIEGVEVISKEYIGEQELVALTTSTGTFIAEGLGSHNSAYAGEAVYSQFNPNAAIKPTRYNPHIPLWRGWDFGYRHPACVWAQLWPDDTLVYLHELYPTVDRDQLAGLSTHQFAKMVIEQTNRLFPEAVEPTSAGIEDFCDPAGNQKKENSEFSAIEILNQFGIDPEWSVVGRKNRINYLREYVEREHKFRVNPHCTLGIKAFSSAYRYPEPDAGQADREMPDLGKKVQEEPYVHLMDALEYIAACNLDIGVTSNLGMDEEESSGHISNLARMYLQATEADQREATSGMSSEEPEYAEETLPHDLIGVEEDSLDEAWLLT